MSPRTAEWPVLAGKLHPPRLSAQHVARPLLAGRLHQHRDRSLILVCAPAGSGKSTVLAEWVAAEPWPSAWISLDERDADPVGFVSYVVAAVRQIFPEAAFEVEDLLKAIEPPPIASLANALGNDLDRIGEEFILVLDDYHLVDQSRIDELLVRVLRHPPRNLHLVVATRRDPDWLRAALRASGRIHEIRQADLRFNVDESAALVRGELGDQVRDERIRALHERSEGWAVGLHLLMLASRTNGGDPDPVEGGVRTIQNYLFAEVLLQLPPCLQDRLLSLSVVEGFGAGLCEALCDRDAEAGEPAAWGRDFLADLDRRNLFLVDMDGRGETFRFHHLFHEFLEGQARHRLDRSRIIDLHRRASAWFAADGRLEDAVRHALAAGDAELAGALVAQQRTRLYDEEQFARLTRLLDMLPETVVETDPELLLAEARIHTLNWRLPEASFVLDRAGRLLEDHALDPDRLRWARGELAILTCIVALWTGDTHCLRGDVERALDLLPPDSSHLRGAAHTGIVAAHWLSGEPGRAHAYLSDQLAATPPGRPIYCWLLQSQGFLAFMDGDFTALTVAARRLLAMAEHLRLPEMRALAHHFIGIAHYARNELEAARAALAQAVGARFNMRLMWWLDSVAALALTEESLGNRQEARAAIADGEAFLLERQAVQLLPGLGAVRAELDRRQGRMGDAAGWAAHDRTDRQGLALQMVSPGLVQAQVFLAQGRPAGRQAAGAILDGLRAHCQRVPSRRLSWEIDAVDVLRLDLDGRREAALARLEELVLATEPVGWIRLFTDLGEPMADLLRDLAELPAVAPAVDRILESFPAGRDAPPAPSWTGPQDLLSDRELEVLALLVARDSNKEIAERLYIAPSTVKRHTLNIFRKLDVNDRRSAVMRAIELGLVAAR